MFRPEQGITPDVVAQGNTEALQKLLERPIPLRIPSREGWKEKPIIEPLKPEKTVPLGPFSDYHDIYTSSIYFGEHTNSPYPEGTFPDSMISLQVRESVADQLRIAQSYLPEDTFLIVLDAYRPIELQQQLYDSYYNDLKDQHPDWTPEKLTAETENYVSVPMNTTLDPDTSFISPHNTSGAVDVALFRLPPDIAREVREIDLEVDLTNKNDALWQRNYELQMRKIKLIHDHGETLNFGTHMDQSGKTAAINYYEHLALQRPLTDQEKEAQMNRRMIYNVMSLAGFEAFSDEWWHYNSEKTQMGAQQVGLPVAEYGEGRLLAVNREHENTRLLHRSGTITLFQGRTFDPSRGATREHYDAAKTAAVALGDYRDVRFTIPQTNRLPRAVRIRP